ncbi:hypothetical protein [Alkalihalobacillus trypoxylicola]|nr:hypothetical protein [Alkalihalobacillus trypoxylicola]
MNEKERRESLSDRKGLPSMNNERQKRKLYSTVIGRSKQNTLNR